MTVSFEKLAEAARSAATRAYAPYSRYAVGAALQTEEGDVVSGCNVENASYGLTNCAERTAVFKAISEGKKHFSAICICGGTTEKRAAPCGACLQVLSEFCGPETPVLLISEDPQDAGERFCLRDFLPRAFHL